MRNYAVYFTKEELKAIRRALIAAEDRAGLIGKEGNLYDRAYNKVEEAIQRAIADDVAGVRA